MRKVMVVPPDSNLFQVIPCKHVRGSNSKAPQSADNMSSCVAPGMEISYIVKFSPESKTDYSYDLNVITEREKFIIPIRAIGCKSILEFPDILDFSKVPVNQITLKPVIISNIGEKITKWKFSIPKKSCFKTTKLEGILEVGESEQLTFQFEPMDIQRYMERMILSYDMLEAEVLLKGESYKANVYLSKGGIKMKPTYVGLPYCDFVEIVNDGTTAVEFLWRATQTLKEEEEKREKRIKSIKAEETALKLRLEDELSEESSDGSLDSDDSYDEDELNKKRERNTKKKKDVIAREFQSRKAQMKDKILYFNEENNTFKVDPETGKIWPKSRMMISVTFIPKNAGDISMNAFCDISGSEERLRLDLSGIGLGPKAAILPQVWSLNDVSVNEKQTQVFKLFNQGQIPFHFKIMPTNTLFGRLFRFDTTEGYIDTLSPNNEKSIVVEFGSNKLGDFSERFEIQLGNGLSSLVFTCEGKVIAPPMKFEESELDFKVVPFGLEDIKEVTLVNESSIGIDIEVDIIDNGEKDSFFFEEVPSFIPASTNHKMRIRFAPPNEGSFMGSLTVKVPNVAQDFVTLSLKGTCQRPSIKIEPGNELNFGNVYLKKARIMKLRLKNTSELKAKYEVLDQDSTSAILGIFQAIPKQGEVEAYSENDIEVSVEAQTRGPLALPLDLKLTSSIGNERIILKAEALGPHISTDVNYKEFKGIKVLARVKDKIVLHNNSEIPAPFTAFTKERNSVFDIEPRTGVLEPDESKELSIVCSPNDTNVFDDILYIEVRNGRCCEVRLRVKATGTSICIANFESQQEDPMKPPVYTIDIGTHYANFEVLQVLNVENRGRRKQTVRLERVKPLKSKKIRDEELNKAKDTKKKNVENEEEDYVFTIDPIEEEKGVRGLILNAQSGFRMNCRGRSKIVQSDYVESFRFFSRFENNVREDVIFILNLKGTFILPQLHFSAPKLRFKYIWQEETKAEPIVKDLEITCQSVEESKGASFNLNLPLPFRIKEPIDRMDLVPGEKRSIQIEFDPSIVDDRMCKTIFSHLEFIYDKDKGGIGKPNYMFLLEGELSYPNLQISPTELDFKCVLINTSKKEYLRLKNANELPVQYHWEFLEEIIEEIKEEPEEEQKKIVKKSSKSKIPINDLFDILPINGVLQPGEEETVEVTFHALVKSLRQTYAKCIVEGGPEYMLSFKGEAAEFTAPVLDEVLDFGSIPYCDEVKDSFRIKNNGKVGFEYFISLEKISRPDIFKIEKQSGIIGPDDSEKIDVRFRLGIPCEFQEKLLVYIGHLEPKEVLVTAVGLFPFLAFSVRRAEREKFAQKIQEVIGTTEKTSQCLCSLDEIQKALSKKQENVSRSQISVVLRPQPVIAEVEVDRRELCFNILEVN